MSTKRYNHTGSGKWNTPDLMGADQKAMSDIDSQWLETKAHRDHWEGVVTVSYTHLTLPTNREV